MNDQNKTSQKLKKNEVSKIIFETHLAHNPKFRIMEKINAARTAREFDTILKKFTSAENYN